MWRRILAIIVVVVFTLSIAMPIPAEAADKSFVPVKYGQDLIRNATYNDIKKSTYAEGILKDTALTIIKNYGSKSFQPLKAATKSEVIAALVRAGGKQTAADTAALALRAADKNMPAVDAYMIGHLRTAQTMGILDTTEAALLAKVTAKERNAIIKGIQVSWTMKAAERAAILDARIALKAYSKAYNIPATREEVAVWVVKGTGLTPIIGDQSVTSSNFTDWKTIKGANVPYVEAALRAKYMSGTDRSVFLPKQAISRGELSGIMKNIIMDKPGAAGLTIGYGTVDSVNPVSSSNPQTSKYGTEITIIDQDGTSKIKITVDKASEKTADGRVLASALPVIKDGTIGNEALLSKGQFVEYISNSANEMQLVTVGKYEIIPGTFISNDGTKTVKFMGDDGKTYTFKMDGNTKISAQGQALKASMIPSGSKGKAVVDGSVLKTMEFDFAPADNILNENTVTINYIDDVGKSINVTDKNNATISYPLSPDLAVTINGKRVGTSELSFDTPALLKLKGGKVVEIATNTEIPEENPNNTLVVRTAKVRAATPTSITLSFPDKPLEIKNFNIDGNTVMLKSSVPIAVTTLHRGDRVKVNMNSAQDKYVSRIEVQTNGEVLKGVYKAKIALVSPASDDVTFSDVSKFGYNNWVAKDGYFKFHVNTDSHVYQNNQQIPSSDLKDKIGQYAYFATVDDFGSEEVIQLNMKTGGEDLLANKRIKSVLWTENKLTLNDGQNYTFQDGSIIVRDGRLLDKYDLDEMGGAWLVLNKTTTGNANVPVISMDGPNGFTNYRIVQGYLHKIGNDYFTIEKPWVLNGAKWTQDSTEDFIAILSNDTYIYDGAIDKAKITKDQFLQTRYKPYKYTWPNYADYLANGGTAEVHVDDTLHSNYLKYKDDKRYHEHCKVYVLVDSNNTAQSIIIYSKDKLMYEPVAKIFNERLMSGKLLSVNSANGTIDMEMASEYLPATDTWRAISATVPQDTDNAAIIKNGVAVKASDLSIGDSLYTISIDGIGILILAE